MKDGLNWTALVPPNAPAPVEQAREQVVALRARITQAREQVDAAKVAVREAERHDTEQMAAAIRKGDAEPRSETAKVEALRAALAESERRAAAVELAVGQAEQDLGAAVEKSRARWARDSEARIDKAREAARRALNDLDRAVHELRDARGVADWLVEDRGFDQGRAVRGVHVGYALSSRSATANNEPLTVDQLVGWMREAIEPPAAPDPVEHKPVPGPARGEGFTGRTAQPVGPG